MKQAYRSAGRRIPVVALTLAAVLFLLFAPGCGEAEEESRAVRMGYLRDDLHQLAYFVARETGLFSEEGAEVEEAVAFDAGPELMSALSAGQLDMGYVGVAPALTFAARGMADIRIVALVNREGSALVIRAGVEGEDFSALKGRTVAVPGLATIQDFLLRSAAQEAGLVPADFNTVALNHGEMLPALSRGSIDAFIASEPYPSQAVLDGSGRVLASSSEIWRGHPCCVLVAEASFVEEHPRVVESVARAHVRATRYIEENPAEAVDIASLSTGLEARVILQAVENIDFSYRLDIGGIRRYAAFMREMGVTGEKDPGELSRELVDDRFLPGMPVD